MKLSVVIPTMPGRDSMLEKLISTLPENCEIVVVDDADLLLAAKRNKGARQSTGDIILFIDDDNYLQKGCLNNVDNFYYSRVGVQGLVACYDDAKHLVADGGSKRNLLTGFTQGINTNVRIELLGASYEVDEVANAFMIPRYIFEQVGGFDEENFPIDLDEADICKRIKNKGYKIIMNPYRVCYHKSQTYSHIPNFRRPLNAYFMGRNRIIFQRKHSKLNNYILYLILFMPIFVLFYCGSLFYRKKPGMCLPFLKGVFDGIRNCKRNPFQQR